MRTFLLSAVLSFAGLAAGTLLPAQDPPPSAAEPDPLPPLTPAEVELIKFYVELRDAELKPHQEASQKIWQKYDDLFRTLVPPEKYISAKVLIGGC